MRKWKVWFLLFAAVSFFLCIVFDVVAVAQMQKYAPVATPFIFFATSVAAWIGLNLNIKINRRNKRADAIIHCNNRYDEIYRYKLTLFDSKDSRAIKSYFARYWGLKSDEFDYWLAKLIDIETFINWLYLTVKAFQESEPLGDQQFAVTFLDGWKEVGKPDNDHTNPWFVQLVTALHAIAELQQKEARTHNSRSEFTILLDVVERLDGKVARYREAMQDDISLKEYRKEMNNQKSKTNDLKLLELVHW